MDPFAEYIHTDTPWDDALAELLGASTSFPSLDNGDAFPGLPQLDDNDGGFTADQLATLTSFSGFPEFTHSDASIPSPASSGTGGTTTEGELSVLHSSPGGSSRGAVQIKGEGSTEGEVSWGVVGEGWGVAPGLLGELTIKLEC